MATLKKIPDSYLTPARTLPQQELADAWITNPEAARLLTFGTRDPRLSDPPHDHGQDGGEVLVDVPLTIYVATQIQRSVVQGASPRVLITQGVILRGGQAGFTGRLCLSWDAVGDIVVYVSLRPYSETNRDLLTGLQATTQITFTPGFAPDTRALAFALTDLSALGDTRYDREVELVVWQAYLPPFFVTFGHRLEAVYLETSVVDTSARETERSELPRQSIAYADIKSGAILGQDLGRKLRDTHNAMLRGMLGRAPGLTNDGRSDTTRSYQQEIEGAHQHQGIDVPDGCGSFTSDGAVLRDTLFAVSFCGANPTAGVVGDYSGPYLHPTGAFDATALRVECRASIPSGLGAIDVRFALRVNTDQTNTRLRIHADVRGWDGVSICTGIGSGVHRQENAKDGDGLYVCEVDPLDNALFVASRRRRLGRAGLWTLAALRNPTPATGLRAGNQQISESVRLNLTHPKLRPSDPMHATADYQVVLRWELLTPDLLTAVDLFARVNWCLGLPSRGF
jgi:hypothetical protein